MTFCNVVVVIEPGRRASHAAFACSWCPFENSVLRQIWPVLSDFTSVDQSYRQCPRLCTMRHDWLDALVEEFCLQVLRDSRGEYVTKFPECSQSSWMRLTASLSKLHLPCRIVCPREVSTAEWVVVWPGELWRSDTQNKRAAQVSAQPQVNAPGKSQTSRAKIDLIAMKIVHLYLSAVRETTCRV
ncbi:unnamed protein product [Plutella xylostella]|uniref:(diamondback moth) hypothetical protein n=1 Tax=Plutella xylostella TaxID=51655 RepID=A0A8S4EC31_PLUXY|nr:unnamed protein product [Plutella xylostella]